MNEIGRGGTREWLHISPRHWSGILAYTPMRLQWLQGFTTLRTGYHVHEDEVYGFGHTAILSMCRQYVNLSCSRDTRFRLIQIL
jgi:hypothetical protein